MRAGILVLGPLVTKYRKAITSLPGGCLIGARPVNIHLNVLRKLGMKHQIKKGYIYANAKNGLKGSTIKFPRISVGATENAILAATLAEGKTILKNCAIEPEIKIDLTNFLNKAGAKIKWIGKRSVAASIGSDAFLLPDSFIDPLILQGPFIKNLSIAKLWEV